MAKQLNVNLAFTADTSKAKQQIQELQKALQAVSTLPAKATTLFDDTDIRKASAAARELEQHLSKAVNVNTGKLDLSRFSSSLKASNKSLSEYSATLLKTGETGQQAFLKLAQAIATADTPVTRVNAKLVEMGTTLKNTARWQISSSILHGFMGAVQSAYGYAQDLNESLNDIRIVTGQNTTQMEKFAEKANKAAKALSTTTLEYTNASLIYYQQGLSDAEVADRTAITIKMANAAGQSAEVVSDQLTAVWNNFYDGSKSLEHYADVMTALGAATASSTDEISEGLNKFASVAETVGLSYEYAASALATVTATTRQSADVVGTAFKTLFARLQDLELGETLDDGTTLGKYSAALDAVGINIKDVNGDMKDMDQILDELGNKWGDLSKDTQVALAQTVAGTRQYTQLVALMDNWDYFQENLGVAQDSGGSLQAQADIYAESWEAAADRVSAAAENIYQSLLDDDFFIDLLNGFEKVLETVGGLVDGLGGLRGVVSVVGSVLLTTFAKQMPDALTNLRENFMVISGQSEKLMKETQDELLSILRQQSLMPGMSEQMQVQMQGLSKITTMKEKLALASKNLTDTEKAEYESKIRTVEMMYEEIAALAQKKKAAEDELAIATKATAKEGRHKSIGVFKGFNEAYDTMSKSSTRVRDLDEEEEALRNKKAREGGLSIDDSERLGQIERIRKAELALYTEAAQKADELDSEIIQLGQAYGFTGDQIDELILSNGQLSPDMITQMKIKVEETVQEYEELATKAAVLGDLSIAIGGQAKHWVESAQAIKANVAAAEDQKRGAAIAAKETEEMRKHMASYVQKIQELAKQRGIKIAQEDIEKMSEALKDTDKDIEAVAKEFEDFATIMKQNIAGSLATVDSDLEKVRDSLGSMKVSDEAISSIGKLAEEAAQAEVDMLNISDAATELGNELPEHAFHASQAITEFGSSVLAVNGLITSVQSAINVFGDDSASAFEKVGAAIGVVMAIMSAYNAVVALSTTLKQSDTIAAAANALGMKIMAAVAPATVAAKTAETGAVWANTAAWYANPIMWIALIIIGVIAAIAGLIAIFSKLNEVIEANSAEGKLKAAEEEAARLGEELTKAKDAANELRESIESYDSAIEKIKTLKEGTEEWRQALQDANDIARQMIDENDELAGKYSFNADTGLIEFDKGALEDLQASADAKVSTVQAHKIRADNAVLQAKSNVSLNDAVKDNNKWYNWGSSYQATSDAMEAATLNKLVEAYKANDGNYAEALKSLSAYEQNWIKSLDMTDTELQALCQEVKNNSDAMHENTKQLMNSTLSGDYEYDTSEYKDFIADTMATDMDAEANRLYEEKYKDMAGGMTDADIQKQYAEMMGWDPNLVKNKNGNKAVYINEEGDEVTISDEQVRRALAQSEAQSNMAAQSEDYINQANQLAEIEKNAIEKIGGADGLSMSEYDAYVAEIKKQAAKQGIDFSSAEIDKFINQYGSNQRATSQITLKDSLSTLGNYDDADMTKFVENISKDLTDEQLELAVDVAASAKSVDDFARQFEQAATAAFIDSLNSSADQAENLLTASAESGMVDQDSLIALGEDKNFQAYLEEQGKSMVSLTASTYSEKMTIISDYYTKLKDMEADALDINQQNYQEDLASYEAILQYKQAYDAYMANPADQASLAQMNQLTSTYGNIDFMAYVDMDTSEIHAKIDEIQNSIEEIEAQEVSLNMEWETTEAVEASLKGISGLSKAFENDMVKMGDSYQMTAEQMKTWAKQYPELFSQAEVTSEGIMKLDAAVVEEYIAGQEAQTKASIEKNIAMLEGNYAELEVEKQMLEAERQMAMGEVELEAASATQLMNIKDKLTQYYIDCGYDEVAANNAALTQMGISQDEYNTKTAELTQKTAETQISSANAGAEGSVKAFSTMGEKIKAILTNLWDSIQKLFSLDFDGAWDSLKKSWESAWTKVDPSAYIKDTQNDLDNIEYSINIPVKYEASAEMPDVMSALAEMYEEEANVINAQMESILTEIAYNKALLTQDLADYGNTDIDTGNDQNLEDLAKISERYHEITRLIGYYERLLDRISKKKDRAFGKNYLNLLAQEKQALEAVYDKQSDLFDLQTAYLATDRLAVEQTFNGAIFQEGTGEIANYTDLLQAAADELNKYKEAYNQSQSDSDKEALEEAEKRYDEQIAILEQYEETLDAWNDQADVLTDLSNQIQDNNLETITTKLEFQVEIDEMALDTINYYVNKLSDDFYMMAESAALLTSTNEYMDINQLAVYTNMLSNQKTAYDELVAAREKGEISQEGFVTALSELQSETMANVEALNELDKTMVNYYGDTLAAAGEELAKYTDRMAHQTSILQHYQSIMDILGKSTDYEAMGVVLEGQSKTIQNELEVAKSSYEMYSKQADYWKDMMNSVSETDPAFAVYKANWEAAAEAAETTQEEILSKTAEWAESLKAVLENKLSGLAQTLENALTGGTSFDQITTSLERAASLQEEYLTSTNKIYETNKLMNTAQQALDKSSNSVAKGKLQNFIKETKHLQDQTDLSQYELEIQQAKYDLLLAEIALEEAQNAKSTVRLQRDSEGNFGYVYTADASAVAAAEQEFADAQNNLYNIGLEGANDYTEKYQQTMSEMYDTLTDLQDQYLSGAFESEQEYQAAVEAAKEYYYEKLKQYSSLYQVALTTDSNVAHDAWSTDFADMTYETEQWMLNVNDYVSGVQDAFSAWEEQSRIIAEETIGSDLDDLKQKTEDITTESEELKDMITDPENGVIKAITDEVTAVGNLSITYANLRTTIQDLTKDYEALILQMLAAKKAEYSTETEDTTIEEITDPDTSGVTPTVNNNNNTNTGGNNNTNGGNNTGSGYNNGKYSKEQVQALQGWLNDTYGAALTEDGLWGKKSSSAASKYLKVDSIEEAMQKYLASLLPPKGNTDKGDENFTPIQYGDDGSGGNTGTDSDKEEDPGVSVQGFFSSEDARKGQGASTGLSLTKDNISDLKIDRNRGYGSFRYGGTTFYLRKEVASWLAGQLGIDPKYDDKSFLPGQVATIKGTAGKAFSAMDPYSKMDLRFPALPSTQFTVSSYVPGDAERESYYTGYITGYDGKVAILEKDLQHFDTGGYTGTWGPYGKLAFLHEKELILNPGDTENFLASMNVLERILQVLDLQAVSSQLGGLLSSPGFTGGGGTLEQNVHIEASFPNATNHSEIEEAFSNLVNLASQYANRK